MEQGMPRVSRQGGKGQDRGCRSALRQKASGEESPASSWAAELLVGVWVCCRGPAGSLPSPGRPSTGAGLTVAAPEPHLLSLPTRTALPRARMGPDPELLSHPSACVSYPLCPRCYSDLLPILCHPAAYYPALS